MRKSGKKKLYKAQTAIEYLIFLGVLTAVALLAFKSVLPSATTETNQFFNAVMKEIVGDEPHERTTGAVP